MPRDGFMSRPLTRRHALASAGLAAATLLPGRAGAQPRFAGREIVATAFGGPSQDLIQRMVTTP